MLNEEEKVVSPESEKPDAPVAEEKSSKGPTKNVGPSFTRNPDGGPLVVDKS